MIPPYDESYLSDAMNNLGEAVDYAVNTCKITPDDFMDFFINSGCGMYFEHGLPRYLSGMSGTELAIKAIKTFKKDFGFPEPIPAYDCSDAYWSGWILAYYQWKTGMPFKCIMQSIRLSELIRMYYPLHEASEEKAASAIGEIISSRSTISNLQSQRKRCGLSQSQLSGRSGINLRTLQQYELRTKDINKASVEKVLALASALCCTVEDIIEYK